MAIVGPARVAATPLSGASDRRPCRDELQARASAGDPRPREDRAASSRFMPRTTWARAVRRTTRWPASAATIRCRCTASACRSAGRSRSTKPHLGRFKALDRPLRAGAGLRASRLVDARDDLLQRSAAAPLHAGDARARRRSHRRGAGGDRPPDPAREPVDLRRLPGIDDERDGLPRRAGPAHRLRPAARRQQRLRLRHQSRLLRRSTISPTFRSSMSARSISPGTPSRPTTRAIFCSSTATTGRSPTRSGRSSTIVIRQCGPIPTLVEWDSDIPDWPVLKAEAAAAQAILDRHARRFMPGQSPCFA